MPGAHLTHGAAERDRLPGGIAFDRRDGCIVAPFPAPLGAGCWAFVEDAAALPWRS